jgi:hypothetical protein
MQLFLLRFAASCGGYIPLRFAAKNAAFLLRFCLRFAA